MGRPYPKGAFALLATLYRHFMNSILFEDKKEGLFLSRYKAAGEEPPKRRVVDPKGASAREWQGFGVRAAGFN